MLGTSQPGFFVPGGEYLCGDNVSNGDMGDHKLLMDLRFDFGGGVGGLDSMGGRCGKALSTLGPDVVGGEIPTSIEPRVHSRASSAALNVGLGDHGMLVVAEVGVKSCVFLWREDPRSLLLFCANGAELILDIVFDFGTGDPSSSAGSVISGE